MKLKLIFKILGTTLAILVLFASIFFIKMSNDLNLLIRPIDIPDVSQNALSYKPTAEFLLSQDQQNIIAKKTLRKFFSPWNKKHFQDSDMLETQKNILHLFRNFNNYYQLNFQHVKEIWFNKIENNMNLAKFPNKSQNAIVIHHTYLRMLPTLLPIYSDYRKAGQGYPFDLLQISAFWIGKPLHVYHISQDGLWAFVQDNAISGWVQTGDIAFVNSKFIQRYQSGKYIVIKKDNETIKKGKVLFETHIGMLLPIIKGKIQTPVENEDHYAVFRSIELVHDSYHSYPIRLSSKNIAKLINQMIGEPYGWGGLYFLRDCSSTLKDLFMSFGIYLPRNSALQANWGQKINLVNLTEQQKSNIIKNKGKPFMTLLHSPGHITLYIGSSNNELFIFQNKWGVITQDFFNRRGRAVIGQAHIAPLSLGKNIPNASATQLRQIDSMTILN